MSVINTTHRIACPACGRSGSYFGLRPLVEQRRPDRTYKFKCCNTRAELPSAIVIDKREAF